MVALAGGRSTGRRSMPRDEPADRDDQEPDEQYVPSIVKMCRWMEVSRSGFYDWRNAPESATAKRRGILTLYVRKSFEDSDDTYGYRRVHVDLVA